MRRFRVLTSSFTIAFLLVGVAALRAAPAASALTPVTSGLSANTTMVLAAYHDFLGRAPTNAELATGTAYPLPTEAGRTSFVTTLAHSSEWISRTVDQMYQDTLGRPGDPTGMTYWRGMLSTGRLTVAQVAASMYSSDEYFNGFGHGSLPIWVADLYTKILGRTADSAGLNYWVGQATVAGRYKVAYAFFQSIESCETRVTALYETLLGRDPDAGGLTFWAARIRVTGDLTLASNLAASDEYWQNAFAQLNDWIPQDANASGLLAGTGSFKRTSLFVGTQRVGFGRYCTGACTSWNRLLTPATIAAVRVIDVQTSGAITGIGYSGADSRAEELPSRTIWLRWATPGANPTATELTTASGSAPIAVSASNDAGAILGRVLQGPFGPTGSWLLWSSASALPQTVAPPAGYLGAEVTGLLPDGSLIGWGLDAGGSARGIVWPTPSNPQIAALPTGFTDARITGSSPDGTLLGWGTSSSGTREGVIWSGPSNPTVMTPPPSAHVAVAVVAATPGSFIGTMTTNTGGTFTTRAVVWTSPTVAPSVLATPAGFVGTAARSISSSGLIVGVAYRPDGTGMGLAWSGASHTPGLLPSSLLDVEVDGVTSQGVVYGRSSTGDHGAIWSN